MIHLPALIQDLGLILIAAAVVVLLFKKLKQPVVLGYLIAGILVGRHVPFFPSVVDTESVKVWAEIGVIFLLFGLGLEFSFKKLASVGKPAAITATFEILFMLGVGYLTGQLFGWSMMDSLFLGGILSISSTTIIVRAFHDLDLKGHKFVSLVFGILIVEDLLAILLLVILSTFAVTKSLSGAEFLMTSVRLGFFMVLWFLIGIYVLPVLLNRIRNLLDNETTLVVSLGLCLLMVVVVTHVGFSPALGAFVMGSILAETREGKKIEHVIEPVRDLFAAVFFVSVGMLIDPQVLSDYFGTILFITFITIAGKLISTTIGSLISGKNLKQSVQTGLSLAQIGEFSFIIATLGVTLDVTGKFLYPIAVAVSAITTFTTPYLIKYSVPFYYWLEKKIPQSSLERLKRYEMAMAPGHTESTFGLLFREYGIRIILNTVIIAALTFLVRKFGMVWLEEQFGASPWLIGGGCILTLLLSAPFIWAIISASPAHIKSVRRPTLIRLDRLQFGVSLIRTMIGILVMAFIIGQFYPIQSIAGLILMAMALIILLFSHQSEPFYKAIENRFLSNLNESERTEIQSLTTQPELAPWDASLAEFIVSPNSALVGKTLMESEIKEKYGVTVTMVERGHQKTLAPGRTEVLFPFDKIYLIGSDEQLANARHLTESAAEKVDAQKFESFGLESVIMPSTSRFINHPIRNSGLREAVNGLIVGIERDGARILNPDSEMNLMAGDLVWIVGDRSSIKNLKD